MVGKIIFWTGLAAVISLAGPSGVVEVAWAVDDAEKTRITEAKALLGNLKDFHGEYETTDGEPLLRQAVSLHNTLTTKSWRAKLQEGMCKVMRNDDLAGVRTQAMDSLLELNDRKGAFKHVRKLLPSPREETVDPVRLQAIESLGKLGQDPAIPQLFDLMRKSKDINVSKKAIIALGYYGDSKRRVLVLEEILSFLKLLKPSRAPGKRVSPATRKRWSDLGRPLVSSLNMLTSRRESNANIWLDIYAANKRSLPGLFMDPE